MKKLLLLITMFCIIISCSNSNDELQKSDYSGNWKGVYTGTDEGSWNINISKSGNVTGVSHSNVYNEDFEIVGNINDSGQLNAVLGSASSGGKFIGSLKGHSGSGTWSNNVGASHSGSWSGNKQ